MDEDLLIKKRYLNSRIVSKDGVCGVWNERKR